VAPTNLLHLQLPWVRGLLEVALDLRSVDSSLGNLNLLLREQHERLPGIRKLTASQSLDVSLYGNIKLLLNLNLVKLTVFFSVAEDSLKLFSVIC